MQRRQARPARLRSSITSWRVRTSCGAPVAGSRDMITPTTPTTRGYVTIVRIRTMMRTTTTRTRSTTSPVTYDCWRPPRASGRSIRRATMRPTRRPLPWCHIWGEPPCPASPKRWSATSRRCPRTRTVRRAAHPRVRRAECPQAPPQYQRWGISEDRDRVQAEVEEDLVVAPRELQASLDRVLRTRLPREGPTRVFGVETRTLGRTASIGTFGSSAAWSRSSSVRCAIRKASISIISSCICARINSDDGSAWGCSAVQLGRGCRHNHHHTWDLQEQVL